MKTPNKGGKRYTTIMVGRLIIELRKNITLQTGKSEYMFFLMLYVIFDIFAIHLYRYDREKLNETT